MRADVGIGPYAERGTGGNMRYIVFDYVGSGSLYLVNEKDDVEMQRVKEYQKDYPGKLRKTGVLETDIQLASPWWNVSRKPAGSLAWVRSRNADNL